MSKWIAEFELEDGDTMPEHMDLVYKGEKIDFHCKPLEQEPCEDVISRKDVLNQIFYSTDNSGDVVLGSVLRHRIENLPSVTPQQSCEDVISRQAVINLIRRCNSALEEPRIFDCYNAGVKFEQYITELPLNKPQEQETGHWIEKRKLVHYG